MKAWRKNARLLGHVLGALFLGGALAVTFLGRAGSDEVETFRERSLDYVAAFAEAASGWLEDGELETLENAAKFMLLGSAVFVEVVQQGGTVVREVRGDISPLPLENSSLEPEASLIKEGQGSFLEVFYPFGNGSSYVRVWLEVPFQSGRAWWVTALSGLLFALSFASMGASFYLGHNKPVAAREKGQERIEVGSLVIDEGSKEVRLCGKVVKLSPKQYALLVLLAREPGRVFSDREILRELWPNSRYANSKDVKQYVYLLRRRLGEVMPGAEALIATVPGFGYKLLSPEEIGLTGC